MTETPILCVLYLLFVRTHRKFGNEIFEINFVIKISGYLFARGRAKEIVLLHAPFMRETHTNKFVGFLPMA